MMAKWTAPADWTYSYAVSFRLAHPSIPQSEIAERIGLDPDGGWTQGAPRIARDGRRLQGEYGNSYCYWQLVPPSGHELAEALSWCAQTHGPRLEAWPEFFDSGGEANLFVSVSVIGHCPVTLEPELMKELSRCGIELQLDVYAVDRSGRLRSLDDQPSSSP